MAVVLAGGLGTRLRPLTEIRPKALCPVANVPLLDLALASVRPHVSGVAANAHHLADQVVAHLAGTGVVVSVEHPDLLGTAGALVRLRDWIDGRPVLVRNADSFLTDDLSGLVAGWDGERPRLLVHEEGRASDFGTARYVGACLLPAAAVAALPPGVSGLYETVFAPARDAGTLELVETLGAAIDCGTPRGYLEANLRAAGADRVVAPGATVLGRLHRVVVWPGGYVGPDEDLHDCIRVGADLTVDAR